MNQPHKLWTILLGSATIAIIQPQVAIAQLSPQQVDSIAKEVTVRIDGSGGGSGVIIERQGDTYFVLTNHHVVRQPDRYEIQTPDGQRYPFYYGKELPGFDLALIQFKSNKNYRVAQLGNSDQLRAEASVYAAGFPVPQPEMEKRLYKFTAGKFLLNQPGGDNGYTMVYSNEVFHGMSGGPILDGMGRVVGVNGLSCKLRLGIPINSFLANKSKLRPLRDASAEQTLPNAADWINSGQGKANNKDYQGAIADYNRALQICPDNADAYFSLGYAQDELKNYQAAIENYNQVLRINPNNAYAYNNRGLAYRNLKEYEKAIADYNQAIRLDPNDVFAYNNRGNAYRNLKEYEKAIADYNQAIRLDPNYAFAYGNRGLAYRGQGNNQAALTDLQKAANLFQQQGRQDDYQKAINRIRELEKTPSPPQPSATILSVNNSLEPGKSSVLDLDGTLFDKYSFEGRAGQTVTITVESVEFDTYVAIFDSNDKLIAEGDDQANNCNYQNESTKRDQISKGYCNAQLTVILPANGRYRVIVNGRDKSDRGRYTLTIK